MSLMNKFEEMGIKSYEWMFDKDDDGNKSGRYISPVKYAQFQKDYRQELQYLTDKYGTDLSGDAAKKYNKELSEWRKIHCINEFSTSPNLDYYKNEEYFNMREKQPKKFELYQQFLDIKRQLDDLHGTMIDDFSAVQMRKDGM